MKRPRLARGWREAGKLLFARPARWQARPGAGSAILRRGREGQGAPPGSSGMPKSVDNITRKPTLLLRLFGLFLLR